MGFVPRSKQHTRAIKFIERELKKHNVKVAEWGIEGEHIKAIEQLRFQRDKTALAARFKPDLLTTLVASALCEVKSEHNGYKNFAIEIDSYIAARMHHLAGHKIWYAFVDLSRNPIESSCYWFEDGYTPRQIRITGRFPFDSECKRLKQEFPLATFQRVQWRGGSGTSHFFIPKDGYRLIPFEDFITDSLIPTLKDGKQ